MSEWTKDELRKIAETDDLHISPFREDGTTYGTPTWIWSVVVDDGLYVRAYNGRNSRWYRAAMQQKAGRITAAGMTREVCFTAVEGDIQNRIDEAYSAKYKDSEYLAPMIGTRARSATVRVIPAPRSCEAATARERPRRIVQSRTAFVSRDRKGASRLLVETTTVKEAAVRSGTATARDRPKKGR